MIIPAGRPAWERANTALDFGGHPNKVDYGGIGTINHLTDVNAAQICRIAEDLAALEQTTELARLVVRYSDGLGSGGYAVMSCSTYWGKRTQVPYGGIVENTGDAPDGFPVLTDLSPGLLITLPGSAVDSFGVTGVITPRAAICDGMAFASISGSEIRLGAPTTANTYHTVVIY